MQAEEEAESLRREPREVGQRVAGIVSTMVHGL